MTQYATFTVGERLLGLDIMGVREIIRVSDLTPVPRADAAIRGLLNLRGQIVTILDLAVRLGHPQPPITDASHIVILKADAHLQSAKGDAMDLVGLLVDAIADVVEAHDSEAEPPPANLSEAEERFVSGVIKTEAGLLVLLNLPELLSTG